MLRYVLRRLLVAVPLTLGVLTLVFVLVEAAPGSPADVWLGDTPMPPDVRQRIERAYGFDKPPLTRYAHWLFGLVGHGELGWSHGRSRPVARVLADALPPTLLLAGTALALHVLIGILLGILSAARRGRWPDRLLGVVTLTLYATPAFWLGLMAVLLFSYVWPLFPAAAMRSVGAEHWPWPRRLLDVGSHLVLPATVLGVASAAAMTRFVRAGLLDALGRDFIRAARARGAGGRRILYRHALRNALVPVINLIGLSLPVLFSGALVVEVVFAWPGMGRITYEAALADDVPVVLATTFFSTSMVILGNLSADVAMAWIDPRIRLGNRR